LHTVESLVTNADYARFTVMLESIQTSVRAIARHQVAMIECCDRIVATSDRINARRERISSGLAAMDATADAIGAKLHAFSVEVRFRLERIEAHFMATGARPRRKRPLRRSTQRRKAT
jgi:hypothetical protein